MQGRGGSAEVSFAQQRVWALSQLEPSARLHNIPLALRVLQPVDADALQAALSKLVLRHPVLVTAIRDDDGLLGQTVRGSEAFCFETHDLRGLQSYEAREREAAARVQEAAWRSFELEHGRVARVLFLIVDDAESILAFVQHHVVTDGWSTSLLLEELSALYRGVLLPPLTQQYVDYSVSQRAALRTGAWDHAQEYWKHRMAGAPRFYFPTRSRARRGVRSAHVSAVLDPRLAKAIAQLAARHVATPFVVLLAAFKVLLARWVGATDVVVGAPCADRSDPSTHSLLGCFLHIQPLRTNLDGDPDFDTAVRRTRETVSGALEHAGLAFEVVAPQVYAGQVALPFNVLVNSFDLTPDEVVLPGLLSRAYPVDGAAPRADLNLYLAIRPGEIRLRLAFDEDVVDADRMRALVAQYEALLREVTANAHRSIWDYSLAFAGRQPSPLANLRREWHGGIPERVTRFAAERIAIACPDGSTVTYGELDNWSQGLAKRLREGGLRSGEVVAVHAHRVPALVPALVGILRAGGAFVVLDADRPASWLNQRLRLAGAKILVRATDPIRTPPPLALAPLCEVTPELALFAGGEPYHQAAPGDVACIGFTSGSTGQPLAVVGTHGGLTSSLPELEQRYGIGRADRFSLLSSIMHDPLQRDVFTPLWFGGSVAIPPTALWDEESPWQWIDRARVTVANLTPSFIRATAVRFAPPAKVLRLAFVIGEPFRASDISALRRVAPEALLVNLYGTTETQRALTHWVVPDGWNDGLAPIGAEGSGVEAIVLNRQGNAAGIGEQGEIHVRSPHLALGYLDEPLATAERFVATDLFRTGDAGCYRPDGTIDYLGRMDVENKVLGYRVDFAEVESALEACSEVNEAVARVVPDEQGSTRLVAYYAARTPCPPWQLRRALAERLPAYMVPSVLVPLVELPRTATGKIDTARLPPPHLYRDALAAPYLPPSTSVEEELARHCSELLGCGPIGIDDDFFSLGGTSLSAIRLLAQASHQFGRRLEAACFFDQPTIRRLAIQVEQTPAAASLHATPPARPSSFQKQLWSWQILRPEDTSYLMHLAFDLMGPLDRDRLESSLRAVVASHDLLRTGFHECDGEAAIRVQASVQMSFDTGEPLRPFCLEAPPLLRVQLAPTGPNQHRYVLVMHHIIGDLDTMHLFTGALFSRYASNHREDAIVGFETPHIEVAPSQHVQWWRTQLDGVPAHLSLPCDGSRPTVLPGRGGRKLVAFPDGLENAVAELARREQTSPFVVLLSAFKLLLARTSGTEDIVVGTPVTHREDPALASALGPHFGVCALRTAMSGELTFRELVLRVRRTVSDAVAHAPMPFNHALQVFFVLHELPRLTWPPGIEAKHAELRSDAVGARFEILFAVFLEAGVMRLGIEYAADLYEPATVDDMASHFFALLRSALDSPIAPAASLCLLAPAERDALLALGRGPRFPLADLDFKVVDSDMRERVDRLAARLVEAGVGPETLVAVSIPRSRDSVAAVLAILRAGGAFLPMDPDAPPERNAWIVQDANPAVVLAGDQLTRRHVGASSTLPQTCDRAAYVMYTSGSTGRPKGVVVTRYALASRLAWMQDHLQLCPDDAVMHKTPLTFDVSVWEVLLPFTVGCRQVIAKSDGHTDAAYLEQLIAEAGVTLLHFVPGMLRRFLGAGVLPLSLRSLRHVVCSGEALDSDLVARWSAVSVATLHNFYGPTEATIDVTAWRCRREADRLVPIGYPMPNTEAHVLDDAMQPCPAGVTGELYLGGPQLARGYLNRPDLTALAFVSTSFAPRLYRTGDLARRLRDGAILFAGRRDSQVKLRGCRVELGEVESAMRSLPDVREAAVLVEQERLVSVYASNMQPNEVRRHLARLLPRFMWPDVLLRVDHLPLLDSGKLDRSQLPAGDCAMRAPRTPQEMALHAIWCDVLCATGVGIDDDFFALGGDSMLAVRMVFRAAQAELECSVADVFQHRTIRALAATARSSCASAQPQAGEPFVLLSASDRNLVERRNARDE